MNEGEDMEPEPSGRRSAEQRLISSKRRSEDPEPEDFTGTGIRKSPRKTKHTDVRESTPEGVDSSLELRYGAKHLMMIFKPVSICMIIVVVILSSLSSFHIDPSLEVTIPYAPFRESADQPIGERLWKSIANAMILLCVVIVTTIGLVVLYKLKCFKIIHSWLVLSSLALFVFTIVILFAGIVRELNIAFDWISSALFMWNFGVMGMMSLYWKAPLIVQQMYLVNSGALMAMIFIRFLPEWSTWVILGVLAIWDLVAVLCPFGPLRMLVETAQRRNDSLLPGIIYSSTVTYIPNMADTENRTETDKQREQRNSQNLSPGGAPLSSSRRSGSQSTGRRQSDSPMKERRSSSVQRPAAVSEHVTDNQPQGDIGSSSGQPQKDKPEALQLKEVKTDMSNKNSGDKSRPKRSLDGRTMEEIDTSVVPNSDAADGATRRSTRRIRTSEEGENRRGSEQSENAVEGVKLGLGDFIFYSILVGNAAVTPFQSRTVQYGEWTTVLSCFVAILVGLALTLFLLAILQKALPALPISIALGLFFYFVTSIIVQPFTSALNYNQVFI